MVGRPRAPAEAAPPVTVTDRLTAKRPVAVEAPALAPDRHAWTTTAKSNERFDGIFSIAFVSDGAERCDPLVAYLNGT
jgi:hypothetical protein